MMFLLKKLAFIPCILISLIQASKAQSISDYFIPGNGWNRITFTRPDKYGAITPLKQIIYFEYNGVHKYVDKAQNYITKEDHFIADNRDLQFSAGFIMETVNIFNDKETSRSADYFKLKDSVVLFTSASTKNYKGELTSKDFDAPQEYLKLPLTNKTITWQYKDEFGQIYTCTGSLITISEKHNGVLQDVPTIKVIKTTPQIKGKTIEYYKRGYGLSKVEYVDLKGITSTLLMLIEIASQLDNPNVRY